MTGVESVAAFAGERLLIASLQGGIVLACVWLLTRRIAGLSPSLQAWVWWLACLKLLLLLAGVPGVPLPVLPPGVATGSRLDDRIAHQHPQEPSILEITNPAEAGHHVGTSLLRASTDPAAAASAGAEGRPLRAGTVDSQAIAPSPTAFDPLVALISLWLMGVVAGLGHLLLALRRARGVLRRSLAVSPHWVASTASMASSLGLRRVPDVRVSSDVHAPQVVGLRRPIVLLPQSAADWDVEERRMAICHELTHVHRRDLLFGWIPVLAARVFFFHPLARLATREYLVAREAACDAIVLRMLQVEPALYGRLLVRMGVARPEPAFTASGSSASSSGLTRRLEMLNRSSFTLSARHRWLVAVALSLAFVPLDLVTAAQTSPGYPTRSVQTAGADRQLVAQQNPSTAGPDSSQEPADQAFEAAVAAEAEARLRAQAVEQRAREAERHAARERIEALVEQLRRGPEQDARVQRDLTMYSALMEKYKAVLEQSTQAVNEAERAALLAQELSLRGRLEEMEARLEGARRRVAEAPERQVVAARRRVARAQVVQSPEPAPEESARDRAQERTDEQRVLEEQRRTAEQRIEALRERLRENPEFARSIQEMQSTLRSQQMSIRALLEQINAGARRSGAGDRQAETLRESALRANLQALEAELQSLGQLDAGGSLAGMLDDELQSIQRQLESVARAQEALAREQQALQEMQQRLSEQMQTIREALER